MSSSSGGLNVYLFISINQDAEFVMTHVKKMDYKSNMWKATKENEIL